MQRLKNLARVLSEREYEIELSALLVVAILIVMTYQVLGRIIGYKSTWVPEIAQLMVVFMVFLTLGRMRVEREHIRVDFFYERYPDRVKMALDVITRFTVIAISLVMVYAMVVTINEFSHVRTPAAGIPTPVLFFAGFLGFLIYGAVYVYDFSSLLRDDLEVISPVHDDE